MEQLVGNLVWKENNCVASRSLPFPSIVLKNKKEEKKIQIKMTIVRMKKKKAEKKKKLLNKVWKIKKRKEWKKEKSSEERKGIYDECL